MAKWAVAAMAILVLAGTAVPARSGIREPVCREASVVDEMTRQVRADHYYTDVDPRLVTEQPTADPRVVRCQVCVQSAPFNTLRFGDRPIEQCVARAFDVQILPGGFVVQNLR